MPYCPSCGGPVDEQDTLCRNCGAPVGVEPGGVVDDSPHGTGRENYASGHEDRVERATGGGPENQSRQEPPNAGRRMLLKAVGGFGVLATAGVLLFGDDGGSAPADDGGGTPTQQIAPTASFSFGYDSTDSTLTITHDGGEAVRFDELFVRGDNVDATGTWAELGGSASGRFEGVQAVVGGDSLTVGVRSDYVARVVWESSNGDASSALATDYGPDA